MSIRRFPGEGDDILLASFISIRDWLDRHYIIGKFFFILLSYLVLNSVIIQCQQGKARQVQQINQFSSLKVFLSLQIFFRASDVLMCNVAQYCGEFVYSTSL